MTQISHFHPPTLAEQLGGAPANSFGTARRHTGTRLPSLIKPPPNLVVRRGKCNQL
jgi:hypothetical protein